MGHSNPNNRVLLGFLCDLMMGRLCENGQKRGGIVQLPDNHHCTSDRLSLGLRQSFDESFDFSRCIVEMWGDSESTCTWRRDDFLRAELMIELHC